MEFFFKENFDPQVEVLPVWFFKGQGRVDANMQMMIQNAAIITCML